MRDCFASWACICYRSKLFLGYSIFKLVHFFKTRSICLNLGQFLFKLDQLVQFGAGPN